MAHRQPQVVDWRQQSRPNGAQQRLAGRPGVGVIAQVCGKEPEPGHAVAPALGNIPGGVNGREDGLNLLLNQARVHGGPAQVAGRKVGVEDAGGRVGVAGIVGGLQVVA